MKHIHVKHVMTSKNTLLNILHLESIKYYKEDHRIRNFKEDKKTKPYF